ncbi:hypothetical protein I5S53_04580 [Pseudomonas juntendi]|uniref:Uncharacterized protein n=1 Tax=Pseudomonas helleri TaxID=1608996 RepID=A0A7X1WBV6_9PSED|nr:MULTISPECIES: hypothetical protein [Pseudomonas]MBH3383253.1 hypothetical protein [Pseudomonas juntendi]MQT48998.1 hypothetical protein [Pseudomonas helleri]
MKRKNVTEYAYSYQASYAVMVTANQLMAGGVLDDGQDELDKCHIYIIATRPNPYFIADSLKHEGEYLSGKIAYKISGVETQIEFSEYPLSLVDGAVGISCVYPFRELSTCDEGGKEVRYIPASVLASQMAPEASGGVLNRCEVLYVGQAIGQGNRSAQQRLMNHATFQKILALSAHNTPDNEIVIFMMQFDEGQVLISMDGRADGAINDNSNETRLMGAIRNPPDKKQKIAMVEAGLIRYFQPHYNEIFKLKFPSVKHKTLQSCRSLDASALNIELETLFALWSPTVKPKFHHSARFDLVNLQNRMSFFNSTGFNEFPGVIKTEK